MLDRLHHVLAAAHAFGYDHDTVAFTFFKILLHAVRYFVQVKRYLWYKDRFRAGSQPGMQCDVAAMTAHHFHNRSPFMGGHRVTQLVHRIHHDAHRRIETDGVIRKGDVIVDGPWQPHRFDTELAQLLSPLIRTVAADNDQTIDPVFAQNLRAPLLAFRRFELQATCGLENRPPTLNDIADAADVHLENIIVEQTLISALNAVHFQAVEQPASYNGA
ncbi:hypothetical protein D3C76_157800 [compost metagenome]